jgi:hypothetical protein
MQKVYFDRKAHFKALAEVSTILDYTEPELLKKIPAKLLTYIKSHADKNYEVTISPAMPLEEQSLLAETKVIMALIYRNCFCTQEEKAEYDQLLAENKKRLIEEYEANKPKENAFGGMVFTPYTSANEEKVEEQKYEQQEKNTQMIEYKKENIFTKILNKLRTIFKK